MLRGWVVCVVRWDGVVWWGLGLGVGWLGWVVEWGLGWLGVGLGDWVFGR